MADSCLDAICRQEAMIKLVPGSTGVGSGLQLVVCLEKNKNKEYNKFPIHSCRFKRAFYCHWVRFSFVKFC